MKVLKFGGTSIGTVDRFLNVINIISSKAEKERVLVVLSAIGGVTDKIIEATKWAERGNKNYQSVFGEIKKIHTDFLHGTVKDPFVISTEQRLNQLLTTLFEKLRGVYLLNECSPRVSDSIITLGEYLSNTLAVNSLRSFGKESAFFDAREFVKTDSTFGDAIVNFELTNHLIKNKFCFANNCIPIINGFTGSDEKGDTTTLGRSGSDYTATILGGALNAEAVEIWTDVDGVLSADPKVVSNAYTLDELSYEDAGSLAVLGGKVIHPKTIVPVEKHNVPVKILNSFQPDKKGTYIGNIDYPDKIGIRTITYLQELSSVTIDEPETKYAPKIFARLFSLVSRYELPIISISKSAANQSISFILQKEFAQRFYEGIKNEFILEVNNGLIKNIILNSNFALISAIGINPDYKLNVTRKIYDVLENNEISIIEFINNRSAQNISFIVNQTDVTRTISVLHDEFFESEVKSNVA